MAGKVIEISLQMLSMASENEYIGKALYGIMCESKTYYSLDYCEKKHIVKVSSLLALYKEESEIVKQERYLYDHIKYFSVYVKYKDIFLAMDEDKNIEWLFRFFNVERLELLILYSPGGASIERNGYIFTVHSKENNHQHLPHIHVRNGDVEIRYHLETLSRFDDDLDIKIPKRDEKKKILPVLVKNRDMFLEWWHLTELGFRTPDVNENMIQYYSES